MAVAPDPYRYILEQRVVDVPGQIYNYSGGCTQLLAGVLHNVSGRSLKDQAKEDLFDPLGIRDVQWMHYPNGEPSAAGGLRLRPRDLAKIGQLVLDHGVWQGRQVVPAAWIEESIAPHIKGPEPSLYGYQWWLGRSGLERGEINWVAGRGLGGQRLFIVPSQDIVVVVLAGEYYRDRFTTGTTAAISQAREEARRLQRASLGPEHIFLGLVRHRQGVAGWVLAELGVSLDAARECVESYAGRGHRPVQEAQIPFSPEGNSVIALAADEAVQLRHNWLGTEHLLLALFRLESRPGDVPIPDVMRHFHLDAKQVRELLMEELMSGRRLLSKADEARGNNQMASGTAGGMVLNHYVLPAVIR